MTHSEFDVYVEGAIQEYAQEHVRAGNWSPDEATKRARAEFQDLLPSGPDTPKQHLFTIQDAATGTAVGILWFAEQARGPAVHAFVYDVQIHKPFRRQGYGTQAFRQLEEKVTDLGLQAISLHVFGHNQAARAMYEKLGYHVVDLIMAKTLTSPAESPAP
jgi:ribosomal protein S18 acetylase RimI-like enzyme